MTPIELFISALLVNTQPLLAFLGVGASVVAVQLAVLAAVAVSIIAVLSFSVYLISKMVSKGGKGKGLEDSDDDEPEEPKVNEISEDDDIKPPKKEAEPKPAEPVVEENIDGQAEILVAQQAAEKATAALNSATQAFEQLKDLCTQMTEASEEYINCDADFRDIKDKAKQDCIALAPTIKALVATLQQASKDAKEANTQVKQASAKLSSVVEGYVESVKQSVQGVTKISAEFPKLTGKARKEYEQVVPPQPKAKP